jgi:hypothetical protein
VSFVVPEPPLQHRRELLPVDCSTVVDVALDLRITVQLYEQLEIIRGEPTQHQAIRFNEDVHVAHETPDGSSGGRGRDRA